MAVSRNDWDVIDSGSSDRLVNLQWITGKVRKGDAYIILNELGRRFNSEVEPIIKAHSWGYAKRDVRGVSGIISEHATGTAVDFNAPNHPIGKKNTFVASKRAKIRQIVKDMDGAVRWGGEWSRPDDMHFELIGGAAKIKQVATKLSKGSVTPVQNPKPTTPAKPAPKPSDKSVWPYKALTVTGTHDTASHNAWIALLAGVGYKHKSLSVNLQNWLKDLGYYKGDVDGNFREMSIEALQAFLVDKKLLPNKAYIDGGRKTLTVKAEKSYLNSQAKHYK